jgi:RNA polymerase primary sigma factor
MRINNTSNWIDQKEIQSYLADIKRYEVLTRAEENRLIERIKQGDDKAKDMLITANLRFVVSVAKQYLHKGIGLKDLISEGNYGLLKAAERYDMNQTEVRFLSYAVWWIKQAIRYAINEHSRIIRLPMNVINDMLKLDKDPKVNQEFNVEVEKLNIPSIETLDRPVGEDGSDFYDIIPDLDSPSPESSLDVENSNLRVALLSVINTLSEVERSVITDYFGLYGDERTLQEIADDLELTKERVRQIKEKAIKKIRANSYMLFNLI